MGSATLNSSWQFHADREPGTKKAFTLSLVAHLLLLALLTMGISWKTSSPAGLEVELWDASVPTQTITPAPTIEVKQEAADIAIKKTKVNPEPPKEVIKKRRKWTRKMRLLLKKQRLLLKKPVLTNLLV